MNIDIPNMVSDGEISALAYSLVHSFCVIDPEFRHALKTIEEYYVTNEFVQEVHDEMVRVFSSDKYTLIEKVNFIRELCYRRVIPHSREYKYFGEVISKLTNHVRKARDLL